MIKHGLLICSFQLKRKYSKKEEDYYLLNQTYENDEHTYTNVIEMFECFIKSYTEYDDNEKNMKMFAIDESSVIKEYNKNAWIINGKILCGSYGIESEMTNKDTKEVVYTRKKEDADIKPFHFIVYVPKDKDEGKVNKGLLLFEMVGAYGVKTITTNYMRKYFSDEIGLTMEIKSVSVRVFIEKMFEKSTLNRITFIRNKVSNDYSDNIFYNVGREEKTYYKPRLKEEWKNKIIDFFDRSKDESEVFEIENEGIEDIKLNFTHDGRNISIRVKDTERFSIIEDIPDKIIEDTRNDKRVLLEYMIKTAESYIERMVYTKQ